MVAASVARLRELLPQILVDKFVEAHPQVLDVKDFERAIEVRMTKVLHQLAIDAGNCHGCELKRKLWQLFLIFAKPGHDALGCSHSVHRLLCIPLCLAVDLGLHASGP